MHVYVLAIQLQFWQLSIITVLHYFGWFVFKCSAGAPACEEGAIQLVNGNYPSEGTIQICVGGVWGTVCDDFWDHQEAKVVCGSLGLTEGQLSV